MPLHLLRKQTFLSKNTIIFFNNPKITTYIYIPIPSSNVSTHLNVSDFSSPLFHLPPIPSHHHSSLINAQLDLCVPLVSESTNSWFRNFLDINILTRLFSIPKGQYQSWPKQNEKKINMSFFMETLILTISLETFSIGQGF